MNQIASKLAGSVRQAKEQSAQQSAPEAKAATPEVAKPAKAPAAKAAIEIALPKLESRRCWPD